MNKCYTLTAKTAKCNDCAQQTDSNNCGVFVILNIAAIFMGRQLTGIEN